MRIPLRELEEHGKTLLKQVVTKVRALRWSNPQFTSEWRNLRMVLAAALGCSALVVLTFCVWYLRVSPVIEARLADGMFAGTVDIYSAPHTLSVGDPVARDEFLGQVKRAGYTVGRLDRNSVQIFSWRDGGDRTSSIRVEFAPGRIVRIIELPAQRDLSEIDLGPQLMANLSANRERRRLVAFSELPRPLVDAVISVEDKHFFQHSGFDPLRAIKAAYIDVKSGRKQQGASTLTMQLARALWLEPEKRWKRKLQEMLITMHLEQRLTKERIFEYYANQIYLGQHDTFSIHGFAEGSRAYFNKDLAGITLPEAALLAGMVQRPSYYNPYRYPERARSRRDVVLRLMLQNGLITEPAYRQAVASGLGLTSGNPGGDQGNYFVDLVRDEVRLRLGDKVRPQRVYTSLDPILQDAAETAVRNGMQIVDRQIRAAHMRGVPAGQPQVALIALDPRTGEVKALVGGRNYAASQLNHAIAMRQPGSAFKPFVYAAALETALSRNGGEVFTPASIVNDEPTTFEFDGKPYEPGNFHDTYMGAVSLQTALAHSLNSATVSLAMRVGLNRVVQVARRAGLNEAVRPTPAVALGAYESTPLEVAGAYTVFANHGMRVTPAMVSQVVGLDGRILYQHAPDPRAALDPRVAYLMVNMLQEVLRSGTGAGVSSYGFRQPGAGKTGTSRDGWFAGFTNELLCVVWVGFDDNRDLDLQGARSALPIWAEFMARAGKYRPYRDATDYRPPAGVVAQQVCMITGGVGGPSCPCVTEYFIAGTGPNYRCPGHGRVAPPESVTAPVPSITDSLHVDMTGW